MKRIKKLYQDTPIDYTEDLDLSLYLNNQKIRFICKKCGRTTVKYKGNLGNFCCASCNLKSSLKNTDWNARYEKTKATKLERHGDPYYSNGAKISASLKNKSDEEKQAIKDKVKATNDKRYGGHPAKRQCQKDATRKTCEELYGGPSPMSSEEVKQKLGDTIEAKYGEGVRNVFQAEEVKQKAGDSIEKHYGKGIRNARLAKEVSDKIESTNLERYNHKCSWGNHDVRLKCFKRYIYHDINFDSSWELALYIYLTDHRINFEYQPNIFFEYKVDNDIKRYFPDFKIEGKLYEVKGDHFFKDGIMINPFLDEQNGIAEAKHQCMLENNVIILLGNDVQKYIEYVENKYGKNYLHQFKNN